MHRNETEPNHRPLALIASVELEIAPLRRRLQHMRPEAVGRKPAYRGMLAGHPVVLVEGGMGKTNAAHALTALLEREPIGGVLGFGVGGAYPDSGLATESVALATSEIYGDEGVEAPGGWLSTVEMGIPLIGRGSSPCYNEIPLEAEPVSAASTALLESGIVHGLGPFVTVSNCSGTARRGAELRARFDALVESMEGAAYAHVCRIYHIPFVEVRAISNLVEDRELSRWRLAPAAEAAARAAEQIVACW